jgi:hypothetical protein
MVVGHRGKTCSKDQNSYALALTKAFQALLAAPSSGNDFVDNQRNASAALVTTMCKAALLNESFALPLFQKYQDILQQHDDLQKTKADASEVINHTSFCKLREEIAIDWIVDRSDITAKEIADAAKINPDAIPQLLEHGHQLRPGLKVTDRCKVSKVMVGVMTLCNTAHRNPLANIYARGVFSKVSKKLDWTSGSYVLTWTRNVLTEIEFRNGDSVDVSGENIRDDWDVIRGWSDMRAALHKANRKDQDLHSFFKSSCTGPHEPGYSRISGPTCKEFKAIEDKAFTEWEQAKSNVGGAIGTTEVVTATTELRTHRKEAKSVCLATARAAGKRALAARTAESIVVSKKNRFVGPIQVG